MHGTSQLIEPETESVFTVFLPTLLLTVNKSETLLWNYPGSKSKSHGAFYKPTRKKKQTYKT